MKPIFSVVVWIMLLSFLTLGQSNPVPLVNNPPVPTNVLPGSDDFTLTLNGTGFATGLVVNWNSFPLETTLVNSSQVTATVPASKVATASTASITVVNPAPRGGISNPQSFQVTTPVPMVVLEAADYATGANSSYGAIADFNNDGRLDVAVANAYAAPLGTVSILLGNGDGTLQPRVTFDAGGYPSFIVAGDFNGDGKFDLAVSNGYPNTTVSILLGNGNGAFQAPLSFEASGPPADLILGDFNADGSLDLGVVIEGPAGIAILLGNGNGTFQAAKFFATGREAVSAATGDFDDDGNLDIAVTNYFDHTLSLLYGNGDGTFKSHLDYATGSGPASVIAADLNRDGKLDLIVTNVFDNTVGIFLNVGSGFQAQMASAVGTAPDWVTVGDFNGDQMVDLCVANRISNNVSVLLGKGDGTFQTDVEFASGRAPYFIAAGDFNGDGQLDLVTTNSQGASASILLQVPVVSLSKARLKFGDQQLGSASSPRKVVLTNSGSASLIISDISLAGEDQPNFSVKSLCGSTIPAGASCAIRVVFRPRHHGPKAAQIKIADSASNSPQEIILTGDGT